VALPAIWPREGVVCCRVAGVKAEEDGDLHIELRAEDNPHGVRVVVEVPLDHVRAAGSSMLAAHRCHRHVILNTKTQTLRES